MSIVNEEEKIKLPHHEQQPLCTTRLAYRQGRKLTAVKTYTISNESNHLLIFGVPSLNLRQETKSLFNKFGKLTQFNITKEHHAEPFTETYQAVYEKIQSARIAKRMLDTKSFYGSVLHICYAPEFETIEETRQKLLHRQRNVLLRLANLQKDVEKKEETAIFEVDPKNEAPKLNMGELNVIGIGKQIDVMPKLKRKYVNNVVLEKKFKPCFVPTDLAAINDISKEVNASTIDNASIIIKEGTPGKVGHASDNEATISNTAIEVIDCTSTFI